MLPVSSRVHCWNMPLAVQIGITNRCNLDCRMCRHGYYESIGLIGDMEFSKFCGLIDQLSRTGVATLALLGIGEPLLHPDLSEMIEYCVLKDGSWSVSTTTNGMLLTAEKSDMLLKSGLHELRVSIDGTDKETLERIRPGAHFETIIRNTKAFKARTGIPVTVNFTLSDENVDCLPDLPEFADSLGVDKIRLLGLLPWTGRDLGIREHAFVNVKNDEICCTIEKLERDASEREIDLAYCTLDYMDVCFAPFFSTYVSFGGDMTPCCIRNDYFLGNVFARGFGPVWNGEEMRSFRKRMLCGDYPSFCYDYCILKNRKHPIVRDP